MHRTATRLADGRELIYYDQGPGRQAPSADTRLLPAFEVHAEIRLDPLLDQFVIVAGHRQERTNMPSASECPLCPSRDGFPTEIPESDYQVVVFENRFPALHGSPAPTSGQQGFFRSTLGTGRCEVVCFTSEHGASFASLSPDRARLVVDTWADRTSVLARGKGVEQIFCFENRGPEIGVTEPHPHGQIYAYPFVTPRTRRMLDTIDGYRSDTGRNLVADLLDAERSGPRVVIESSHWTAFVPFAARWPYEVHIYPQRTVPDLPSLDDSQRDDFVTVYLDILARFDRLFGRPAPYVSGWHQAPIGHPQGEPCLHLELFTSRRGPDKLKYLAGSEAAMDVFVGDIVPEEAAQRLRDLA